LLLWNYLLLKMLTETLLCDESMFSSSDLSLAVGKNVQELTCHRRLPVWFFTDHRRLPVSIFSVKIFRVSEADYWKNLKISK
jgi:hypothetical protein